MRFFGGLRFILLLALALGCAPAAPSGAAAETQTWSFGEGFTFVSPVVTPDPAVTSATLLSSVSAVEQVFAFDPASQAFTYQIKLADGRLMGTPFALAPGSGYVVKARGGATFALTGARAADGAARTVAGGFSLVGFPPLLEAPRAAALLFAHAPLKSLFRWDPARASFTFVIRLGDGSPFGEDFTLAPGEAYFVNAASAAEVRFGVAAPVYGSVSGRVGGVAGAAVALVASEDGSARVTVADADGRYSFADVAAGAYRLHAQKAGFSPAATPEFTLAAGEAAERDLSLQAADPDSTPPANEDAVLSAPVTVSSGAPVTISPAGEPGGAVWLAPLGTTVFFASDAMTTAAGDAAAIPAPRRQGVYRLFVIDAAGNRSNPSTAAVTVSNPPPVGQDAVFAAPAWRRGGAPVALNPPGDATLSLWFAPAGATLFRAGVTMTRAAGDAAALAAPAWEGAYRLFLVDATGGVSAPSAAALTVDNTPPTVSLSDSLGGRAAVRDADTVTITATFADTAGIDEASPPRVTLGSLVPAAPMTRVSNLVWTYAWDVPAGVDAAVTVAVQASDRAGNPNAAPTGKTSYTVDNTPPSNQDQVLPASVTARAGAAVALTPAGEPGGAVWLAPAGTATFAAGDSMTAAGGDAASIPAPALPGVYRLFVADAAGNVSPPSAAAVTVPVDRQSVVTLNAANGVFTAPLPAFAAAETATLAVYSLFSSGYTVNSRLLASAPARAGAPAPPALDASPAVDPGPPHAGRDRLSRALERETALLQDAATGPAAAPRRAPARAPQVGETGRFWALNSLNWPPSASDWTSVTATCKAVGTHCYLFQDNNSGSYKAYPETAWPILRDAFDRDIYDQITAAFGEEPRPPKDIDGDAKIYILFTQNVNRQSASGYFDSTNELTQAQADNLGGGTYYSNQKEILFMQVPSYSFDWGDDLRHHVCGVMAHEFLHMIVYNQRVMLTGATTNEEDWLNEGLAQVAQDVAGYGYQYGTLSFVIDPFLRAPGSYSLTNFSFNLGQYGMSYLFARHLADRGVSLRAMGATPRRGQENVEAASGKPMAELFRDFAIALAVSNTGASDNPVHRFTSINLRATQPDGTTFNGPAAVTTRTGFPTTYYGSLRAGGVNYVRQLGGTGADAEITVSNAGAGVGVTLVRP